MKVDTVTVHTTYTLDSKYLYVQCLHTVFVRPTLPAVFHAVENNKIHHL